MSQSTIKISRPGIFVFFLCFNMIQFGLYFFLESSFTLVENQTGIGNYVYSQLYSTESTQEQKNLEKTQLRLQQAVQDIQQEFTAEKLTYEAQTAHLLRNSKIHHFASAVLGFIALILGIIAVWMVYWRWNSVYHKIHGCDSAVAIRFRPCFSEFVVALMTFAVGLTATITSYFALKELIYYRDEAWVIAAMNYRAMTELSSHYKSLLLSGILLLVWAVLGMVIYLRALQKMAK